MINHVFVCDRLLQKLYNIIAIKGARTSKEKQHLFQFCVGTISLLIGHFKVLFVPIKFFLVQAIAL